MLDIVMDGCFSTLLFVHVCIDVSGGFDYVLEIELAVC